LGKAKKDPERALVRALGEMLAARSAQISVTDRDIASKMHGVWTELSAELGHAEPVYFPLEELHRSIDALDGLPKAIESAKKQSDLSLAGTYQEWLTVWREGFPYPRAPGGGIHSAPVAAPAKADPMAGAKKAAGEAAVKQVRSNMVVGLGTGSTTNFAIDALGARAKTGELKGVVGVPTSTKTTDRASALGIPLSTLKDRPRVDITIDGADEAFVARDGRAFLIKGGGGALEGEKPVAAAARKFVVIVDETKLSEKFGSKFPLPIAVAPGSEDAVAAALKRLGGEAAVRLAGDRPFRTDAGSAILDVKFANGIADPDGVARALEGTAGVRGHGLFLGMADEIIVGRADGSVEHKKATRTNPVR
jgi:ribose 5-phosphate isomerase A